MDAIRAKDVQIANIREALEAAYDELIEPILRGEEWKSLIARIENALALDQWDNRQCAAARVRGDVGEQLLADAYQAVGMLGETFGLAENEHFIRLQDTLAYGKPQDGGDLLPFPLLPNLRAEKAEAEVAAYKEGNGR